MKKTIIIAIIMFLLGGATTWLVIQNNSEKAQETLALKDETTTVTEITTIGEVTTCEEEISETTVAEEVRLAEISYKLDSQWEVGESYCYGYTISIRNTSEQEISDWRLDIDFDDNVTIMQLWNGEYTTIGKSLSVSSVSYNESIPVGGAIDFGFNCQLPGEGGILAMKLYSAGDLISGYGESVKADEEVKQETQIASEDGKTPFEKYGRLSVDGTNIVGSNGEKVVLQGISTHGIAWFGQYVDKEGFRCLRDDFNSDIVRLALYSSSNEGYSLNLHQKVKEGVEYATDLGLYAIIDWHILANGNPNTDKANAITFFTDMAQAYCDYDNVIYEICNEPNGGVEWERDIKPYAEEVISVIRKYDNDAIIIVGTPNWSQDVDIVAKSPIANQTNLLYALHFYAATHKDDLRNKLISAVSSGLPVIVSEFGICDASGDGGIDEKEAQKWIDLLRENKISYVSWNLSNKNESSALISPNCSKISGWTDDELSASGKWIKKIYNN